jgi:hypothetical protein
MMKTGACLFFVAASLESMLLDPSGWSVKFRARISTRGTDLLNEVSRSVHTSETLESIFYSPIGEMHEGQDPLIAT